MKNFSEHQRRRINIAWIQIIMGFYFCSESLGGECVKCYQSLGVSGIKSSLLLYDLDTDLLLDSNRQSQEGWNKDYWAVLSECLEHPQKTQMSLWSCALEFPRDSIIRSPYNFQIIHPASIFINMLHNWKLCCVKIVLILIMLIWFMVLFRSIISFYFSVYSF